MKPPLFFRLMLPLGLLLISASFLVSHFFKINDSLRGFLAGAGIGLMLVSLIKQWKMKRVEG